MNGQIFGQNVELDSAGPIADSGTGLKVNVDSGIQLNTIPGGIDSYVSLMLHLDNNFTDSSQYVQTVSTASGSGTYPTGKFSQGRDTTSGAYPYVANQPADFNFGSGDFTIDLWAKSSGGLNASGYIATAGIAGVSQDWAWRVTSNGTIIWDNPGTFQTSPGAFLIDGNFHHYAFVRSGSSLFMFVDGVNSASVSYGGSVAYTNTNAISFGGVTGGGDQQGNLVATLDEIRVSKGIARWTSTFTPPTAPYSATGTTSVVAKVDNTTVEVNGSDEIQVKNAGISLTTKVSGILPVANATIASQAISASDINWALGNVHTKTLAANTTFTFSSQTSGQTIHVRLTNTASNYTVTWPTVKWASGTPPTMSTGAVSDLYTFVYDGSSTYGYYTQNMS